MSRRKDEGMRKLLVTLTPKFRRLVHNLPHHTPKSCTLLELYQKGGYEEFRASSRSFLALLDGVPVSASQWSLS